VLGRPVEFFRSATIAQAVERDPEGELQRKLERACTPNGVYGLKVFSTQFDLAEKTNWADRLPNLRFVHLERLDLLGQAISQVRATQTMQFESSKGAIREPYYDRAAIGRLVNRIAHRQARWRAWFARNGLSPLYLTYESVSADPSQAVAAIGKLIGLSDTPVLGGDVGMAVQRDELSQQWRERFVGESADLSYLDDELLRIRVRLRRWRERLRWKGST